jgi:hypothetical protein
MNFYHRKRMFNFLFIIMITYISQKGCPGLPVCGGIFRDCKGTYVGRFSCNLSISNSLFAELTAAMLSIEMANDKGWRSLWLECDSLLTVQTFTNSLIVLWKLQNRWANCLKIIRSFHFRISHIYIYINKVTIVLIS